MSKIRLQIGLGNPRALVVDHEGDSAAGSFDPHVHHAPAGRVPDGIAQQVDQDLLHPLGVGLARRQVRLDGENNGDARASAAGVTRPMARRAVALGSTAWITGLSRSSSSRLRSSRSLISATACPAESSTSKAARGTVAGSFFRTSISAQP